MQIGLASRDPDISKGLLIDKLLRGFKEHEYVWIAWKAASNDNYSPRNLLDFFNEKYSYDYLFDYIKKTLSNLEEEDIDIFVNNCRKEKEEYFLNIDINLYLKDDRLCWFLINRFTQDYNIFIFSRESILKRFKNSGTSNQINNYILYKHPSKSRLYRQTNNPKVHKNINNPRIFILALIYLNPEITINIVQRNIDLENYIAEFDKVKKEKINLNKYIKDKDFIEWSKNYIDKNFKYTVFPQFIFEKEKLHENYIYAYFDDLYTNNREKYINNLNKLKKSWQQNVFRSKNKDNLKKKFHLPLRKNTKVRLKELAEIDNISESELLEKLINREYEEYKDYK
ncbi:hypothetical protein [Acinetobacter sp. TTH0-4]|uniref:hypothetical protein n=1 Tax=Acinetobacter sp. TTH0-4 TaxID=1646498 RepID=UPI001D0ED1EB|nr:hypothetical protein [Acinetobacter sp. TTH0-4]